MLMHHAIYLIIHSLLKSKLYTLNCQSSAEKPELNRREKKTVQTVKT